MEIGDWGLGPIPNPQSPIPNPQSPFELFENKENILNKNIIYLFNGNKINNKNINVGQMTDEKSFNILVYDEDNSSTNKNNKTQSPETICPECKCSAFLSLKDYNLI